MPDKNFVLKHISNDFNSRRMFSAERHRLIMELLKVHKSVEVSSLSAMLEVSEVTIRKDLEKLERDGLLIRSHGGAVLNENLFVEPSFNEKEDKYIEEKMRIAAEAAKLVTDGMTIALNAGTTTTQIAKQIKVRENLTVVTNAINIAWELMGAEGVKVFLTGGNLRPKSYALVGTMAEQTLRGIFVDMVFVGVNGISVKLGLTTPNMEEALVNRAMMEAAKKVAVVADHSKFDKVTFSLIATLDQIDMVITDSQTEKEQIKKLQEMGKTVIIA